MLTQPGRKVLWQQLGIVVMWLLVGIATAAESTAWPDVTIRGFGTTGIVYHGDEGVRYRRDISQAGGARAGQISWAQDSMLGLQLNAYLNERFEMTVQGLSRLTTENNFAPQLTWAYLKYKAIEGLEARLGRLGVESYLQGDSAEVGYANLQIRQPIIFYPRTFDGIDVASVYPLGEGTVRFKAFGGWTLGELYNTGDIYDTGGSTISGGLLEYVNQGWTGRVSYAWMWGHDEIDALMPGGPLRRVIDAMPNYVQVFNSLSMAGRAVSVFSSAVAYDRGPWQGIASYNLTTSANWSNRHEVFANIGYRIGPVTPYLAYSTQRSARQFVSTGLPHGQGFDVLTEAIASAQAGINLNQSDFALGARYDFADNMALKFQVDHIRYKDPENIVDPGLLSEEARSRCTHSITVFSLALDFVF